jgi:CheY-like chemotaxis protein
LARKILLADDSVTAQNMGRKILADAGYEIIAVNNGSAALKKIAELKPDLVILDVYMPGYSGLEVCQRLKESPETSRIPVLLSVGKLEPFKPEEAQRVRADAFIVKPFEASELLSALSKLEDRVVPRAEASKGGRFARAMAAVEEADRSRDERGTDDGWKSRLGMPHPKTEPEEKVADEASIYNPINRDLRTVVEKPVTDAAASKTQPAAQTVAVSAFAQSGLPKDVTPEEVAAIAAAAAQIQMAGAVVERSQAVPENRVFELVVPENLVSEDQVSENRAPVNLEAASSGAADSIPSLSEVRCEAVGQAEAKTEATPERQQESKVEVPVNEPVAAQALVAQAEVRGGNQISDNRVSDNQLPEEAHDDPVTMAATAESVIAAAGGESRWTAVSIALNAEEAAISLDLEMQKAHAASAGADSGATSTPPVAEGVASEPSFAHTGSAVEEAAAEIPNLETKSVPELVPVVEAAESAPAPAPQLETAAIASALVEPAISEPASVVSEQLEPASPAPVAAEPVAVESAPVEANAQSATVDFGEKHEDSKAEVEVSAAAASIAPTAGLEIPLPESPVGVRAEPEAGNAAQNATESRLDPDTVKNTAAAWASWRQTRDIGKGSDMSAQSGEAQSAESDTPESVSVETARAVAAGAEQISQEVSAATPAEKPQDVASIVDSVLADLRPKLMEEISRKMAMKK